MFEIFGIAFAFLWLFILPGYTLLRAVFPRRSTFSANYDIIYRFTLGVVLSIIITLLIAFTLGTIGYSGGPVRYHTPYIVTIHAVMIVAFFVIGWYRGAYPWTALIHPKLYRVSPPTVVSSALSKNQELMREIEMLSSRRHKLQAEIEACGRRAQTYDKDMAEHYKAQRENLRGELEGILKRLEELDIERKQVRMV